MSDDRDGLGELLHQKITDRLPALPTKRVIGEYVDAAISAAIKAGYRKPQQVTTIEELDALRVVGTAIEWGGKLYGAELAVPGDRPSWFGPGRATATIVTPSADFPATVLHIGGAE